MDLAGPAGSAMERALSAQTTDIETVVLVFAKFIRSVKISGSSGRSCDRRAEERQWQKEEAA